MWLTLRSRGSRAGRVFAGRTVRQMVPHGLTWANAPLPRGLWITCLMMVAVRHLLPHGLTWANRVFPQVAPCRAPPWHGRARHYPYGIPNLLPHYVRKKSLLTRPDPTGPRWRRRARAPAHGRGRSGRVGFVLGGRWALAGLGGTPRPVAAHVRALRRPVVACPGWSLSRPRSRRGRKSLVRSLLECHPSVVRADRVRNPFHGPHRHLLEVLPGTGGPLRAPRLRGRGCRLRFVACWGRVCRRAC